jgi:hypothetical protein
MTGHALATAAEADLFPASEQAVTRRANYDKPSCGWRRVRRRVPAAAQPASGHHIPRPDWPPDTAASTQRETP